MSFDRELTINDYINIVKRKSHYVIGFFFIFFPIVLAYAILKSPTYQSTATILIESQHIKSGDEKERFATERFAKLNQVVLSKENVLKIAKKYKLYGQDKKNSLSSERLYFITRNNIIIEKLKAEAEGWESSATFAFNISFQHYDAQDTLNITNDLVDLFLLENDKFTKGQVIETEQFFSKEEEKRRLELESVENQLSIFKRKNSDSLPENKQIYIVSLERLEKDLRANQLEYRATKAELRSLDVSLETAKAGNAAIGGQERAMGNSDLDGLRAELAKQKSIYNDSHPSVRALQRRIDAIVNSSDNTVKANSVSPVQSIMVAKVQAQIETANDRLASLKAEEANIRAKISQAENSLMRSAQTEGEIGSLIREYENAKTAYNEIKAKFESAKIAKNIEVENKGERFVLIEAPLLPESPIKPNRKLIIIGGLVASILASVGLVILMDLMSKGVRGVDAIASVMGIQPIAAIPYIKSDAEEKRKIYMMYYVVFGVVSMVLIALLVIHFFVMPLDILMSKIVARF